MMDLFPIEKRDPIEILDGAIEKYNPRAVFAMFSGGHDSLCSTSIVANHPRCDGVIHINTGIGIPQTREYVRETCKSQGWNLKEYHPPGMTYREMVMRFGFPGPGFHSIPYRWLKERCIEQILREHKQNRSDVVMFCTGVRLSESSRRMGHVKETFKKGAQIWTAPILHWTDEDKHNHMKENYLPRNWVVDVLCMSGECLCGAFAKPGEIDEIEMWFPEVAAEIRSIEEEAKAAGKHAHWGQRPPRQRADTRTIDLPLCWSCESKLERLENHDGNP